MFCKQCGQELAEDTKFCSNCGTSTDVSNKIKPKKKINKKLIIGLCIGIAGLLVIVGLMLAISSGNNTNNINKTPESVAENYVIASYTADPDRLLACIADFELEELARAYGMPGANRKQISEAMERQIEPEDRGTCQVLKSYIDYDSSALDDYMEDLEYYGISHTEQKNVEDGCIVVVEAIENGEYDENFVFCLKYNGKWYALDID